MGTAIEVFWGNEPEVRSEREFLSQLVSDLNSRNIAATILANFFTKSKSRQVDFLIVTDNHVCHVELKNYAGVLVGSANGPWSSRGTDGTLQAIERQNPYHQAFSCRTALSDDMHKLAAHDKAIPRPPGGKKFFTQFDSIVCIFPRLAEGSEVPSDYKVQTLGYPEFFTFLTAPGPHPSWSSAQWEAFILDQALVNAAGPGAQIVHRTAAATLVSDYRQRFSEFHQRDLHELIPLPLSRDGEPMAAPSLPRALQTARHLQLIGPSGCGKSHLLKHTLLHLGASTLPVLVEAGMYEGRLSALIDRSVARFTTSSASELLRAAAVSGQAVLLAIDGYNECPEPLRATLAGDLSAFCLRTEAQTIITTQARAELPAALTGAEAHSANLEEADRLAVLNSYGAAGILPLCDPFTTAYELSIAAECATELNGTVTRGTLFASFIRKRLSRTRAPALVRDTLRQLALVMDERLTTWLPLDEVWRISEDHLARQAASVSVLDEVLACTITRTEQGKLSFTHELLGRFLTVEALRRDHSDPPSLARQLRLPRHADLPQLAAETETDRARLDSLLIGLADWLVYFRALRGETGQAARRAVRHAAGQLLERITAGLASTTFTILDQFQMTMTGGWELSEADHALLAAIGALLAEGEFVEKIAGLLDATDAACRRSADVQAQAGGRRPTPSVIVSAVLEPFTSASRSQVAAAIVVDAVKTTRYDSRLRQRHMRPRINVQAMATLLEGATPLSYGRLLLLCHLVQVTDDLEAAALVCRLLHLCWDSSAYHIQLDCLAMTRSFARRVSGHSLHEEIADALAEIQPPDNWALSTMLVESLDAYGLIESPYDENLVRAQIEQVLCNPSAQESRELAYSVVTNQFEDVIAEPYVTVINELTAEQRTLLYTCASLGSPAYGFWNDWLLQQLLESGDQRALPAYERWATHLHKDNSMIQEVAKCYTLAVQGWAQFVPSPPTLTDVHDDTHAAWECYGAIVYWMHRPGMDPAQAATQCAPYWQRLRTEFLPAAVDPLYWLRNASEYPWEDSPSLLDRIMHAFPDETRPILEWSLEHPDDLTSIFPPHVSPDRAKYLIGMLSTVGNTDSAELLRPYADDPLLGSSAIVAIKLLSGQRSSG
jgi:Nuclease-related domain